MNCSHGRSPEIHGSQLRDRPVDPVELEKARTGSHDAAIELPAECIHGRVDF